MVNIENLGRLPGGLTGPLRHVLVTESYYNRLKKLGFRIEIVPDSHKTQKDKEKEIRVNIPIAKTAPVKAAVKKEEVKVPTPAKSIVDEVNNTEVESVPEESVMDEEKKDEPVVNEDTENTVESISEESTDEVESVEEETSTTTTSSSKKKKRKKNTSTNEN